MINVNNLDRLQVGKQAGRQRRQSVSLETREATCSSYYYLFIMGRHGDDPLGSLFWRAPRLLSTSLSLEFMEFSGRQGQGTAIHQLIHCYSTWMMAAHAHLQAV